LLAFRVVVAWVRRDVVEWRVERQARGVEAPPPLTAGFGMTGRAEDWVQDETC